MYVLHQLNHISSNDGKKKKRFSSSRNQTLTLYLKKIQFFFSIYPKQLLLFNPFKFRFLFIISRSKCILIIGRHSYISKVVVIRESSSIEHQVLFINSSRPSACRTINKCSERTSIDLRVYLNTDCYTLIFHDFFLSLKILCIVCFVYFSHIWLK